MLSGPHQKFAEGIANGLGQTEAYQAAYPDSNAAAAAVSANRLIKNAKIIAKVTRIRRAAEVLPGGAVLELAMKRWFLYDVVMSPIGRITPDSPLCQKYTRTRKVVGRGEEAEDWETERWEMPDKLRAVELDAKLAGELSDKVQLDAPLEIHVTIGS